MSDRIPEQDVIDPGLDESIKKLTPEIIADATLRVLERESSARLRVFLDTCVQCGL
jgi:hypothetical protein